MEDSADLDSGRRWAALKIVWVPIWIDVDEEDDEN